MLAQLLFHLSVFFEKRSNYDKVNQLIDVDLMFTWDTMDEDLEYINDWIDRGHFYNEDLGHLYERASLIYLQKGESLLYFRYLGYALYYLETGRFDECREMLDKWEGNPMFDQDIYREILLRDLIVPYYQVRCMYEIAMIYEDGAAKADIMEKESELEAIFRDFIDICEENGYMKTELYTLLRLQVRATAMF